jgi:hypothetical protein
MRLNQIRTVHYFVATGLGDVKPVTTEVPQTLVKAQRCGAVGTATR